MSISLGFNKLAVPTAIALETSKGEFAQGIALGIILVAMAFLLTTILHYIQGKGMLAHGR